MKVWQKNLVVVCVLLTVSGLAIAEKQKVFAQESIGVFIKILPIRIIEVDEIDGKDVIIRISSNISEDVAPMVYKRGMSIPMNDEIYRQYCFLSSVVDWDGVGIRYEIGDKIEREIKDSTMSVRKTSQKNVSDRYEKNGATRNTGIRTSAMSAGETVQENSSRDNQTSDLQTPTRREITPTRVIFVDENDKIIRIVSNTQNNGANLHVRRMFGLRRSRSIQMNKMIQQQYNGFLSSVDWNGVGIRYERKSAITKKAAKK